MEGDAASKKLCVGRRGAGSRTLKEVSSNLRETPSPGNQHGGRAGASLKRAPA